MAKLQSQQRKKRGFAGDVAINGEHPKTLKNNQSFIVGNATNGPVAQFGWSVRLITERSRVQISPGPLFNEKIVVHVFREKSMEESSISSKRKERDSAKDILHDRECSSLSRCTVTSR